ncbi:MAG: diguanylate cyclase [Actinomycetota bacterium]
MTAGVEGARRGLWILFGLVVAGAGAAVTLALPAAGQTGCAADDPWCQSSSTTALNDAYDPYQTDPNTDPYAEPDGTGTTGPGSADEADPYGADPYADPYVDPSAAGPYDPWAADADPYDPYDPSTADGDPYDADPYRTDPYADPYADPYDPDADPYDPWANDADPYGPLPDDGTWIDPTSGEEWPIVPAVPLPDSSGGGVPGSLPFIDPAPTETIEQIDDAYRSSAIDSVRSRQDTDDDVDVTEVERDEVPRLTASRLVLVIDALAELGAFRRTVDPAVASNIRFIRSQVPADGLTAAGYRAEVQRFGRQLGPAIELLEADGMTVGPALKAVSSELSPELIDTLQTEGSATLDPAPWVEGLADLVVRNGAATPGGFDLTADQAALAAVVRAVAGVGPTNAGSPGPVDAGQGAASTEGAPTETDGETDTGTNDDDADAVAAATAADDGGEASAWSVILGAIGALAAVFGSWALTRRRRAPVADDGLRPDPSPHPDPEAVSPRLSVNELLDASRRMSASLDPTEVGTIVLAEARRLVAAEGGIVILRTDDELVPIHHEPPSLFQPEVLADPDVGAHSCVRRVMETGQATVMVAADEPLLVEVPMALAAVPLVVDGRVAGALMVVRVSSRPFDRDDVEALELLAPMVGTSLQSATAHDSATELAETEPLTGLKNRRRLANDLAELHDAAAVAYVMVDVDHFKNFNDTNGHAAGDEALRRVARALERSVRPDDRVYRYGGEEFCVLLPQATTDEAIGVAERIRAEVEATDIPGGEHQPSGRVTVSVGVAWAGPTESLAERADAALYAAKAGGRNQVQQAADISPG